MSFTNSHHFPAAEKYTYLNTPGNGLLSQELVHYRAQLDVELLEDASIRRVPIWDEMDEVKSTIASFVGCENDRIGLIPNFSYGYNLLLPMLKEKTFLVVEGEYPSVLWPIELADCKRHYVPNNERLEQNLEQALNQHQIDVLAISITQFSNGLEIDVSFLKALKDQYPSLIIIADGTQFLATKPFDFDTSLIDVLITSSYKWQCAGFGNGFICLNERMSEELQPISSGFNTTRVFDVYANAPTARYFEPGHQDLYAFGSLGFSLNYIQSIGLENIHQHNQSLVSDALDCLAEFDLVDMRLYERATRSSIIVLKNIPGLFEALQAADILGTQRDKIRIGFHFYNTAKDVVHLKQVISSFFAKHQ